MEAINEYIKGDALIYLVEYPVLHCRSGRGTKPDFLYHKGMHVGFRSST